MYAHGGLRRIGVTLIMQAPAGRKFSETNRVTYECEKHCIRGAFAYLTDIQGNGNAAPGMGSLHPLCTNRNKCWAMSKDYKDYCLQSTGCNSEGEFFGQPATNTKEIAEVVGRNEPAPAAPIEERKEVLAEADERSRQAVGLRPECWPSEAIRQDVALFLPGCDQVRPQARGAGPSW